MTLRTLLPLALCAILAAMSRSAAAGPGEDCSPTTECRDGIDNDLDGDIDCSDNGCDGCGYCVAAEGGAAICNDGRDNDGDGFTDCADRGCDGGGLPTSQCSFDTEFNCTDGFDNDRDGRTDCADGDCTTSSDCGWGWTENGCNTWTDSWGVAHTWCGTCDDGTDSDWDGATDCRDLDCDGVGDCEFGTELTCADLVDNDGDGRVDCDDPDCSLDSICISGGIEHCSDGIDNDSDGLTDCDDVDDCDGVSPCPSSSEFFCSNGTDDDDDTFVDCEDADCSGSVACNGVVLTTGTATHYSPDELSAILSPNMFILLDISEDMVNLPCVVGASGANTCLADVITAISASAANFTSGRYGLAVTAQDPEDNHALIVVPIDDGTDNLNNGLSMINFWSSGLGAAPWLDSLDSGHIPQELLYPSIFGDGTAPTPTRNLAEGVESLAENYYVYDNISSLYAYWSSGGMMLTTGSIEDDVAYCDTFWRDWTDYYDDYFYGLGNGVGLGAQGGWHSVVSDVDAQYRQMCVEQYAIYSDACLPSHPSDWDGLCEDWNRFFFGDEPTGVDGHCDSVDIDGTTTYTWWTDALYRINMLSGSGQQWREFWTFWGDMGDAWGSVYGMNCAAFLEYMSLGSGGSIDPNLIDWTTASTPHWCEANNIIAITRAVPNEDMGVSSSYKDAITPDIQCKEDGTLVSGAGSDKECTYDNVAAHVYDLDTRSDLSDVQGIEVDTIAVGSQVASGSVADRLYSNVQATSTVGTGDYFRVSTPEDIATAINFVISEIMGDFTRELPVVQTRDDDMIYSFYEFQTVAGKVPEGHVRLYKIDDDPTSAAYGQQLLNGSGSGGSVWDAGDILESRTAVSGESNPDDRDGSGARDIYTYFPEAEGLSGLSSESSTDHRQGFDYQFARSVGSDLTVLSQIFDLNNALYDFNDDSTVNYYDLQMLVDFTRGVSTATYSTGTERGDWKLGDTPHATHAIVTARNEQYSIDSSYRTFLDGLQDSGVPDIVLSSANDGMLHAFELETGSELWAWVPASILYRAPHSEWGGRLVDLMLSGRIFLVDGTPVVEDIWLDDNNDGVKDCSSSSCEWHRVVVVQQGFGGTGTLALDITDTQSPQFLWETFGDENDYTAMGHTVSRPIIADLTPDPAMGLTSTDTWSVLYGSGRPPNSDDDVYASSEANIYAWPVGDDYWGTTITGLTREGTNMHPESSVEAGLDMDADGHDEYGFIATALAGIDSNADGHLDVAYFAVTTTYMPTDEGGAGHDDLTPTGSSYLYKACLHDESYAALPVAEVFDPYGDVSDRPEVYYAPTTSWHTDGSLGIYWGTGSPYSLGEIEPGYTFAVKDMTPYNCSTFTIERLTAWGTDGVYALEAGEQLTTKPLIAGGVVYFATYVNGVPDCDLVPEARLYALDYELGTPAFDTNGDGVVDSLDSAYTTVADYISQLHVTDQGAVIYAMAEQATDGSGANVGSTGGGSFGAPGVVTWMEVF